MNFFRKAVLPLAFPFIVATVSAQESSCKLGLRLGGGMSANPGVGGILVPEDYYSNYTFADKWQAVPTCGVFMQYHRPLSPIAVEGGIGYWQRASQLVYDDTEGLHYTVTPRYHFLGIEAMVKVYPWRKGFNIAVGGRVGANLNADGIAYASNQEEERFSKYHYATEAETERLMQEELTGRPDIAVGGGLGCELGEHWAVDLRYFLGLSSSIKTETNTFDWVEKLTHGHHLELTASYLFHL